MWVCGGVGVWGGGGRGVWGGGGGGWVGSGGGVRVLEGSRWGGGGRRGGSGGVVARIPRRGEAGGSWWGLGPLRVWRKDVDVGVCDRLEWRADSNLGIPGLLQAFRAGHGVVANAPG